MTQSHQACQGSTFLFMLCSRICIFHSLRASSGFLLTSWAKKVNLSTRTSPGYGQAPASAMRLVLEIKERQEQWQCGSGDSSDREFYPLAPTWPLGPIICIRSQCPSRRLCSSNVFRPSLTLHLQCVHHLPTNNPVSSHMYCLSKITRQRPGL